MSQALAQFVVQDGGNSALRYDTPGTFQPSIYQFRELDRREDFHYLARLNLKLQKQFGEEYYLQCFTGDSAQRIPDSTLRSLAKCYAEVFNESWGEDWTIESALREINEFIHCDSDFMPVMTVLFKEDQVIGFSWGFLMEADSLRENSGPFSSSEVKRHESVEVAKYWMQAVGQKKSLLSIRELGVLKEYRQDKTPYLTLPIFEKVSNMDCNVAFFRTKLSSKAFKWSLGVGFVPLQFFLVDNLLLMKGNIRYAMSLLSDSIEQKLRRKAQVAIISNIKRYLCE